ncbi:unnamed protein product [Sphagnum balticum]
MGQIIALIRSQIQHRYSNIIVVLTPRPDHVDTLFVAMFKQVQNVGDEIGNKVKKYLSLGIITSSSFIDMMEWWMARKDVFLAHYQIATDYLGTLATLTPSERVIKVPSNRAKATADIKKALGDNATTGVAAIFYQIIVEQNHWEDKVLDDGVVELMNSQFEHFVLEAKIM